MCVRVDACVCIYIYVYTYSLGMIYAHSRLPKDALHSKPMEALAGQH